MVKCAVITCKNYYHKDKNCANLRYHRYPKEKEILKKWKIVTGLEPTNDTTYSRICSSHFKEDDYSLKDILLNTPPEKRKLKKDAIPSINVPKALIESEKSIRIKKRNEKKLVQKLLTLKTEYPPPEEKIVIKKSKRSKHRSDVSNTSDFLNDDDDRSLSPKFEIRAKMCRTCLCSPKDDDTVEMKDLHGCIDDSKSQITYADFLMSFSKVQIDPDDELPQKICEDCTKKIKMIYNYRNEIESNEKYLLDYQKNLELSQMMVTEEIDTNSIDIDKLPKNKNKQDNNNTNTITNEDNSFDYNINYEILEDPPTSPSLSIKNHIENDNPEFEIVFVEGNSNYLFCSHCSFSTKSKQTLDEHELKHFENENFCVEVLSYNENRHKKNIECRICDMKFNRILDLKNHLELHELMPESLKDNNFEKFVNLSENTENIEIIEYITQQLKNEKFDKLYSITNDVGDELRLSDSDTNSDTEAATKTEASEANKNDNDDNNQKKTSYICELCNMKFSRKYKILQHQNNEHNTEDDKDRMLYMCKHCKQKFVSEHLHEYHLKIQCENENATYKCDVNGCNKRFIWKDNFLNHKSTQHSKEIKINEIIDDDVDDGDGDGNNDDVYFADNNTNVSNNDKHKFTCMFCPQVFDQFSELKKHEDTHQTEDNRFECYICHAKLGRKYDMIRHYKLHDPDLENKKFQCQYCEKKFTRSSHLKIHIRLHTGEKPYKCDVCGQCFIRSYELTYHKRQHDTLNAIAGSKRYACTMCSKSFLRLGDLKKHKDTHNPASKKYECDICHKKFARISDLKRHSRAHNVNNREIEKKLCTYCGKEFSSASNLTIHIRRHTGEKPYKCEICGKGFPRSSDLACHQRMHTGEKPHLCTICGKTFSRSNKLILHTRIHNGERPHKCPHCERSFIQSNDLKLHIRRHTGEKPYECGICGKRYIQKSLLQVHRRKSGHLENDVTNSNTIANQTQTILESVSTTKANEYENKDQGSSSSRNKNENQSDNIIIKNE